MVAAAQRGSSVQPCYRPFKPVINLRPPCRGGYQPPADYPPSPLRNPKAPLCKGRDALRKQSSGLFLAKAGRGSDLGRWMREAQTEGL